MSLTCLYFLPEVMMKFTRRAMGLFVTLNESGMHLITAFLDISA